MVQSSFHMPETLEIDLDRVRALLAAHVAPSDQQEAFELILLALMEIQEHFGWVSRDAARLVAEHLHVPFARVYELLTFYGDFKLAKPGRHRLQLCYGTACYAMGAPAVHRAMEAKLGIAAGETTPDGEVTFDLIPTCLGACDLAPLALFDTRYYTQVTPTGVGSLMDEVLRTPRGGAH